MKQAFLKRTFLNPVSALATSYIQANVADSENGEVSHNGNMLIIADCDHVVEFEFYLGNAHARHLSLKKINLLIEVLTAFRDALVAESELIEKID